MRKALALVLVPLALAVSACGGLPYSKQEMQKVLDDCHDQDQMSAIAVGQNIDWMGCLRDGLPKLSDEQLERIDSLIDGSTS